MIFPKPRHTISIMSHPFQCRTAVAGLFLLTYCFNCGLAVGEPGSGGGSAKPKKGTDQKVVKDEKQAAAEGVNWVITVKDTVTMNFGPVKVIKKATTKATNPSCEVAGDYTGTFSFKDTQDVKDPHGSVDGKSTSIGKNLKFTLSPVPHPLVQPKGDLNPLTKPGVGPDYQGQGTMELVTEGSGTATAEGRSTSGSHGRRDTVTFKVIVTGSLAKVILSSPQGDICLNGKIQQGDVAEDEFVPEPLKVPAEKGDGFQPEPLKVPKGSNVPFKPEPLKVPKNQ
jgi:hypothetical protein